MTLTAESFVGRVLAVFSRRSPGFRPPPHIKSCREGAGSSLDRSASTIALGSRRDAGKSPPLRLARATSPWKATSSYTRLRQRRVLLELFGYLRSAHQHTAALDLAEELDFVRSLADQLALARDVAVVNALDTATVQRLEILRSAVHDLVENLGHAQGLARELLHNLRSAPSPADDRDLAQFLTRTLDELVDGTLARDLVLVRVRASVLPANRDLILVRNLTFDLIRVISHIIDLALVRDLAEACENLSNAANNFLGADVTDVDPAVMDLAWIRWNRETRWPTLEWADRIRRASVETPAGSGIFTILPEQEYDSAEAEMVH